MNNYLTWFSGTKTFTVFSSSLDEIWRDLLLDPLLDLDNNGGLLLVAPRPANRLFNKEGLRAHMKAWNDDTVKTPNLFNVCFVARDTCVNKLWGENNQDWKLSRWWFSILSGLPPTNLAETERLVQVLQESIYGLQWSISLPISCITAI